MANMSWNKWYAKCPYYVKDDGKKTIECSGVCDGNNLAWRFKKQEDFDIQMETFCKDHYKNCEVFQMLDGIYNEED